MSSTSGTPDPHLKAIREERRKVYGDPKENHQGIAQIWAPLLQPHAEAIASGEPLPPHVVALMMVGLKLDRMRLTFHQDNYDDLRNYLLFAEEWQKEQQEETTVGFTVAGIHPTQCLLFCSESSERPGD